MEIHVLHRQGKSIREIARETGASRNTVRAVLRGNADEQYGPRAPRPTNLDPLAGDNYPDRSTTTIFAGRSGFE